MKVVVLLSGMLAAGCATARIDSSVFVMKAIAAADVDEMAVDSLYDAYLCAIKGDHVAALTTIIPRSKIAVDEGPYVVVSVAFYIHPNLQKAFELAFPRDALEHRGSGYVLKERLVLAEDRFKGGTNWIVLKRPNKAPEPTPGSVMPRAEPRVTPAPDVAHL